MNRPIAAPAGMIDSQFGVTSIRQLPPLTVVELTSTFDAATGYSWSELRLNTATGLFVAPSLPLTGNLAFDVTGNVTLPVGTRCLLAVDRDQTGYDIIATLNSACADGLTQGCVPPFESGSGSGSGDGPDGYCKHRVLTAEAFCGDGQRTLVAYEFDLTEIDGRLRIVSCSQQEFGLGPCSPDDPGGAPVAVVTKVCPVLTALNYLDHDSAPQTANVVTGITVERTLIIVPAALGVSVCNEFDDCCSGSGSGSGGGDGECTQDVPTCPGGVSTQLQITAGFGTGTTLHYMRSNKFGDPYLFVDTTTLGWTLFTDAFARVWNLRHLDSDPVKEWVLDTEDFDCTGDNVFEPLDPADGEITLSPVFDCSTVSYNCVDGACVGVAGAGGTYPTLAACDAACGGGGPTCDGTILDSLPATLTATVGAGTCGAGGSHTMTASGSGLGRTWTAASFFARFSPGGVCDNGQAFSLVCEAGALKLLVPTGPGGCDLTHVPASSGTTSPLDLTFHVPACWFDADAGTGTITVTVAE